MSQTSTWAVPSAPSGLAMRNTVNTIVDVLRSCSSGATAPSPTVPGMFWFDNGVSPAVLRQRDAANTSWVLVMPLAQSQSPAILRIPGGGILQRGGTSTTGSGIAITFPEAFTVAPGVFLSVADGDNSFATWSSTTTTGFYARVWRSETGAQVARAFNWFAWGY